MLGGVGEVLTGSAGGGSLALQPQPFPNTWLLHRMSPQQDILSLLDRGEQVPKHLVSIVTTVNCW